MTHRPFGLFVHGLFRGHPSQADILTAYLTYQIIRADRDSR
jgi:hypothetical protein